MANEGITDLIRSKYRGEWVVDYNYQPRDAVTYQGSVYFCNLENMNDAPPSANWTLFISKGDPGDAGQGGITLADVYPVGCIYTSIDPTNPATVFGFGTWVAFGAGRVLVGYDATDPDFDTVEETGGAKTKAISAHAGSAVADHAAKNTGQADVGATKIGSTNSTATLKAHVHSVGAYVHDVTQPNAHTDLNVVQPYIVAYFWKRTA